MRQIVKEYGTAVLGAVTTIIVFGILSAFLKENGLINSMIMNYMNNLTG